MGLFKLIHSLFLLGIDGSNKTIGNNLNSKDPYSLLAHKYVGSDSKALSTYFQFLLSNSQSPCGFCKVLQSYGN